MIRFSVRTGPFPVFDAEFADAHEASSQVVARDARLLGAIVIADTVRSEAGRAIESFAKMGITSVLLTGDICRAGSAQPQRVSVRLRGIIRKSA